MLFVTLLVLVVCVVLSVLLRPPPVFDDEPFDGADPDGFFGDDPFSEEGALRVDEVTLEQDVAPEERVEQLLSDLAEARAEGEDEPTAWEQGVDLALALHFLDGTDASPGVALEDLSDPMEHVYWERRGVELRDDRALVVRGMDGDFLEVELARWRGTWRIATLRRAGTNAFAPWLDHEDRTVVDQAFGQERMPLAPDETPERAGLLVGPVCGTLEVRSGVVALGRVDGPPMPQAFARRMPVGRWPVRAVVRGPDVVGVTVAFGGPVRRFGPALPHRGPHAFGAESPLVLADAHAMSGWSRRALRAGMAHATRPVEEVSVAAPHDAVRLGLRVSAVRSYLGYDHDGAVVSLSLVDEAAVWRRPETSAPSAT